MGLKKRDFTGTIRAAVLKELKRDERLSKGELLDRLRGQRKLGVSVKKLTAAIGRLVDSGKLVMEGQRAAARFRRARDL